MRSNAVVLLLISLTLCACARGPDIETLKNDIQSKLDTEFKPGLFTVAELRRMGSAPVSDDACRGDCLLVYFNAQLEFLEDYDLTSWEDLNLRTFTHVLGATEKGVHGFAVDGNNAGEMLQVYGTGTYDKADDAWVPIAHRAVSKTPAPDYDESLPSSQSKRLLAELEQTVDQRLQSGQRIRDAIIQEELALAKRNISLQLDRLDGVLTVVSGVPGAGYHQAAQDAADYLTEHGLPFNNYPSAGSVENCGLVHQGMADLAIVQSNVAAMAYIGQDAFSGIRMDELRALASLYPEAIHIVTLASSELRSLEDLHGRRVGVGLPGSGSRIDAVKVLTAQGIELSDLTAIREASVSDSIELLEAGEIDAFFATHEMPAQAVQQLASDVPLLLLPITGRAKAKLIHENPHYVALTIPARTYPNQDTAVETVAATALLIARRTMADDRVEEFLTALMGGINVIAEQSFRASFLSRQTAHVGVSIPTHPAAERYFSNTGKAP